MLKHQRVFVYGTLKKGQYFHDKYLGGDKSEFVGKGVASPDYSLYIDGMPHLIREATDKMCKGELYLVDSDILKSLDDLEAPVYKRELIEVYNDEGQRLMAWSYLRPKNFKGKQFAWKEEEFT